MIFNGKSVIVTGASEGVGRATARLFANAGANLMLVARGRKKLDAVAEELRDKTRVMVYAMDVADDEACATVLKKTEFEYGGIHVLINNAGFHARGRFEDVKPEELAQTIDVNLRAPILLTRLAIPYLREVNEAAVINVGSLAGRTPVPGSTAYCASKAGLRAFTYALAEEMTDSGIKFAVVSPGPIDTGFIMDDIDGVSDLTFSQPMSTAEDVAQAILDLCGNNQREQSMPAISGFLTTMTYLWPSLGRAVRPALEKRGQRAKKALKAKARREKREQKEAAEKREDKADAAGD